MTQRFLYMRHRSTVHPKCAVFQEIDGEMIQVGTDFGVSELDAVALQQNRVIHWENDLYAINRDTIFKYDVANSGDWEPFYTLANPETSELKRMFKMGWTPASVEGSGVLVCAYASLDTREIAFVRIDKDFNITEEQYLGDWQFYLNDTRNTLAVNAVSWRNSIVFKSDRATGQVRLYEYNLKEKTMVNLGGNGYQAHDPLLVVNDNIYYMGYGQFTDSVFFHKKSGLSFINQATIGTQERGTVSTDLRLSGTACEIDGKIFLFYPGGNQGDGVGWQCHEITLDANGDFLSQANVTSVVIPSELSATNGEAESMTLRIDGVTNSGIDPIYEMMIHANSSQSTSAELYRWSNAPSGILELVAHTLNNRSFDDISTGNGTGGGSIWSGSGTLNVSQPCLTVAGANVNCEFTVYGDGQAGVALELFYDKEGENTRTRGTIASTTVGSVVGNRVIGLAADNSTKITIGWSAALDGIVSGDNPKVSARVFIP